MKQMTTEEIPEQTMSHPALLFLYHRVEQILGTKTSPDALITLNDYLEQRCGAPFIENPAAFERVLTSREQIFEIAGLLTINETYFFREGIHFNLLVHNFLPNLIKLGRPARICSAACSIGCEAYSIAMLLDFHTKNKNQQFDYEIDAFDIDAEVIETAKSARYTSNTIRTDGAEWKYILDSYLIPDGSEYIVSHNIREKVNFFPHNIMDGLNKQYDVIFFRNALIYFSAETRRIIMDNLAESLFNDGILFLGISETSSIRHPLLINRYLPDVFYFQKISSAFYNEPLQEAFHAKREAPAAPEKTRVKKQVPAKPDHAAKPAPPKPVETPIDCGMVITILENQEGRPNAQKVLETLIDKKKSPDSLDVYEIAASVTFFLNAEDWTSAALALSRLEHTNASAVTSFLRGEYHFLLGNVADAEKYFEEAAYKDKAFWPAFYRISSLAAKGNRTRYEYKLKKACESLELGKEFHYECFIGGFSPDYFQRILEKKLT